MNPTLYEEFARSLGQKGSAGQIGKQTAVELLQLNQKLVKLESELRLPNLEDHVRRELDQKLAEITRRLAFLYGEVFKDHPNLAKEAGHAPEDFQHVHGRDLAFGRVDQNLSDLLATVRAQKSAQRTQLVQMNQRVDGKVEEAPRGAAAPEIELRGLASETQRLKDKAAAKIQKGRDLRKRRTAQLQQAIDQKQEEQELLELAGSVTPAKKPVIH